jgi:hypothetical protein
MPEDAVVRDVLADMTAASLERGTLSTREHMIARLGALVASGAPPMSYLLNLEAAGEVGLNLDDVTGVLVAVAPIVGAPRVVSAAQGMAEGIGLAVLIADEELASSED